MLFRGFLAIAGLIAAVLLAQWFEEADYYDPWRGRRHCAAEPAAIAAWSQNGRARQAADTANLAQWLNDHAGDVNHLYGAFCQTPLHTAARFGRDDLAELLITRGADLAAGDEPARNTALHVAAQYGNVAVARVLVTRGANVNAPNKYGRTSLHDAVSGLGGTSDLEGRLQVARLLIARGADINAPERGSGRTPLDEATGPSDNRANGERMTELLLSAGASPRTVAPQQSESPLERASSSGNVASVRHLLDAGAEVNTAGRDTTALAAAAFQGHVDVVTLLLERGADASRAVPSSRLEGNGAPLAMALMPAPGASETTESRKLQVARLLIDRGAAVDARAADGQTALHRAASRGQLPAVDLLVQRRAAINAADAAGITPLHLAVKEGHTRVAARLLEAGANVRLAAKNGATALDVAAGDREMEALLRRYAKQ
jgi:ankyrin repeat protein